MFAARGCRTLILVDACRSGSEPGAVFEVPGAALEERHEPTMTMHDFRWDHALLAGRKIFRDEFPADVVVLLIEAQSVDYGLGLSPCVSEAVEKVVARVRELVRARVQAEAATQ
jgi:hydrogenase maturation protease